jgi:phytoene/squalene synthetase
MMAVMVFDGERRGRLITEVELSNYTRWLAAAVTEALHHFIGHCCKAPRSELRYRAAVGAHITHMLRDTLEDIDAGYINIPREVIETNGINPRDVHNPAYRDWVMRRVELARDCFRAGRAYLSQIESLRCRLAGYAYMARFESVLDAVERDGYRLRAAYPECKTLSAGIRMGRSMLSEAMSPHLFTALPHRASFAEE